MDMNVFHAIMGRLEASKASGWLVDYLVAWHGPSGELKPAVTVWRANGVSETAVHRTVSRALIGLVAAGSIVVTRA